MSYQGHILMYEEFRVSDKFVRKNWIDTVSAEFEKKAKEMGATPGRFSFVEVLEVPKQAVRV